MERGRWGISFDRRAWRRMRRRMLMVFGRGKAGVFDLVVRGCW